MKIFIPCGALSEKTAQTTQIIEITSYLEKFGHKVFLFAPTTRRYTGKRKFNIKYVPTVVYPILGSIIYQIFLFFYQKSEDLQSINMLIND